jgi:hypothetical protein
MLLLYTLLLLLFGVAKFLIARRVASLERRFSRIARQTDKLVRESPFREGNSARADPFQVAKRQYQLGLLAQKRERLEEKHISWQRFAKKFGNFVDGVRNWKGKKLPYTFGVLDVMLLLSLIDYLALGEYTRPTYLVESVMSWISTW